ncbi:hypothetical protein TREAZ_3120 [Leadbettera azotonutricia ZAS-9]|uniref:Uncharacterized protein n=1 Tax=Leadbettera azotonutricia (strain ATCC BAA-888 / DSM 13862 / ZAS-9) TaxID=545695 RepID=F5YAF0_LEAAZ|nr:hypothetical protein TREAZ_3120 [Leadbettera azotonutricia ZAS-9]
MILINYSSNNRAKIIKMMIKSRINMIYMKTRALRSKTAAQSTCTGGFFSLISL